MSIYHCERVLGKLAAEVEAGVRRADLDTLAFLAVRRLKHDAVDLADLEGAVIAFATRIGLNDAAEFWMMFAQRWVIVEHGHGDDAYGLAAARARDEPTEFKGCASDPMRTAANVAYPLAESNGWQPFPFPVERLAEVLCMSAMTSWRAIGALQAVRLIQCTDAHWLLGKKAKVFKWTGPRLAEGYGL